MDQANIDTGCLCLLVGRKLICKVRQDEISPSELALMGKVCKILMVMHSRQLSAHLSFMKSREWWKNAVRSNSEYKICYWDTQLEILRRKCHVLESCVHRWKDFLHLKTQRTNCDWFHTYFTWLAHAFLLIDTCCVQTISFFLTFSLSLSPKYL